jgi:glycosyltransferase involved in cell wall biosynthesis
MEAMQEAREGVENRRTNGERVLVQAARPQVSVAKARIALIHDWLPVYAGAERVLEQMLAALPHADVFSLIDFLPDDQRAFLQGKPVSTSFIQGLPFARRHYRNYLPLAPLAIEQFDLSSYDVVISSSYVVAKGALTAANQLHISYVHSPMRYAWDLQFQYLREGRLERGPKSALARLILHYMRLFDSASADRVDVFVANSHTVARRIWKTYRRQASVIYPPVDTQAYVLHPEKENYYVTVSRLVPYKRVDLIVEAFSQMPDRELIVIGHGPDFKRIAALAGPNVSMLGYQPHEVVRHYMQRARAFVFAAEEDFGIVPVEAQACGTPVIAYGRGGITESVIPGETGLFFYEQSTASLRDAVRVFEGVHDRFDPPFIRLNAERFSVERFCREFSQLVEAHYGAFVASELAE